MDAFIEKIVQKRRTPAELLMSAGIALASAIIAVVVTMVGIQYVGQIALVLSAAVIYLGYRFQTRFNIEFEYLVTNDSLDVDKIVSQRKRTRIFSSDCKSFDAVGKVHGHDLGPHLAEGADVIFAGTNMASLDLYFVLLNYKGKKTILYFEPDKRMLDSFRRYIPRKILS